MIWDLFRVISVQEGRKLAESMGCPYLEWSAKSSLNINKIFHTILVEINKYENNVDLRKLGCKKLFEFFIKNERCLLSIFYLCVILNCLLCITYIFFGFFIGLRVKSKGNDDNLHVGSRLFFGFWNFLFTFVGLNGMCKRNKDYLNYVKY